MENKVKVDVEELNRKLQGVFPMPQILSKILKVVNDPKANVALLERTFEYEPSISLRILSLANSAYYGRASKVTNIRAAITLLGFNLVKSLAIQAGLNEQFRLAADTSLFSGGDLWKHSVGVGVCARMISRRLRLGDAEDYFTLGLLHDMGLLIEFQFYREAFLDILGRVQAGQGELYDIEREILGVDHAALAEMMFVKWNLPAKLSCAVRYHHRPLEAPEDAQIPAGVVCAANAIVRRSQFGFSYSTGELDPAVLARLRLEPVDLDVLQEDFGPEAEEAAQLLE